MQVIDKSYPGYHKKNRRASKPTITFNEYFTRLSKAACADYGVFAGMNIHFITEPDRLYFYVDEDKSGFNLSIDHMQGCGFRSKALMTILCEKYPQKVVDKSRFLIRESNTKWNGNRLMEVMIHKRIITRTKK